MTTSLTLRRRSTIRAVLAGPVAALAVAGLLAACSSSGTTSTPAGTATTKAAASGQAKNVTVTDPWVKAAESGMTGAFFLLRNTGSAPVQVVSASSPISMKMELHETVMSSSGAMQMQEKKGGFTLAAGQSHEFKPGSDHVMFMGVSAPVKAGSQVTFTLAFADGSTLPVTAEVRNFTGAKETYVPGATSGSNPMPTMTGKM